MFKFWYVFPMLAFTVGILVGCGSSSSGSGNNNNTLNPNGMCAAGQVWSSIYGCMAPCPNSPGQGIIPGSNPPQCTNATTSGYGYYTFAGSMNVVNMYQFQFFLQGQGICNQWTWNWGTADCGTWGGGGSLQIAFSGSTNLPYGSVIINAFMNGSWGYGGATTGVSGTFQPTNNNTGYSLLTYGSPGTPAYNSQIQVIVSSSGGTAPVNIATDPQIRVDLYYQGIQFASVSANRGYGY